MEEVRHAFAVLCGIEMLRTVLSLLLPEGGLKRCAQFGFAAVQTAVLAQAFVHMTQLLVGVFT